MRKLIFVLFVLTAMTTVVVAQSAPIQASSSQTPKSSSDYRGYGYVFAAPGVVANDGGDGTGTLHFGVGGEGLIKGGFGVGGEIGGLFPVKYPSDGFGVLSAGANYHFLNASKSGKVVPFVNGGYTMFFRNGVANGAHFGGGVNYWFKERVGLRFEVRDHVVAEAVNTHFVGFRFGLTFR